MNGYQSESEDNSPKPQRACCLIEDKERCNRLAGNACYAKRIQKTVSQKKLKLVAAESVSRAMACKLCIVISLYNVEDLILFKHGVCLLGWTYFYL